MTALSELADNVATVPEKSPAIVPKEPDPVVQTGASLTVRSALVLLTANPLFNSILI